MDRKSAALVHIFLPTLDTIVCPEVFGVSISQLLLPGLPFIGFISHAISLSIFGSPRCVITCGAAPVTHLILIHYTSSVIFLQDLSIVQNSMYIW